MSNHSFDDSDALLLLSLLYVRKPVSVEGIQGAAESIRKEEAITDDEIKDGLERLGAAEIARKVPSGWTLCDSATSLNEKIDEQCKLASDFSPSVGLRVVREFLNLSDKE